MNSRVGHEAPDVAGRNEMRGRAKSPGSPQACRERRANQGWRHQQRSAGRRAEPDSKVRDRTVNRSPRSPSDLLSERIHPVSLVASRASVFAVFDMIYAVVESGDSANQIAQPPWWRGARHRGWVRRAGITKRALRALRRIIPPRVEMHPARAREFDSRRLDEAASVLLPSLSHPATLVRPCRAQDHRLE